jgi:(1->4)-alpha-D-glucan 1-alpha-D-glucosylmutase
MQVIQHETLTERAISLLREGRAHAIVPRATYRLQFHKDFTFDHAIAIIPYLRALGVSHVYTSPLLQSRPGSPHGYDITDHNKIDPELGGYDRYRAFVEELKRNGMGIVLDFVPNHMGIGSPNHWWRDVLKNGRCSRFGHYFDLDWDPLKPELRNKLLLSILGGPYGEVLENGELKLKFRHTEFIISYYDHNCPVSLNSIPMIFEGLDVPAELLRRLHELPDHCSTAPAQIEMRQHLVPALEDDLRRWLSSEDGRQLAEQAVASFAGTPGDPASYDRLHQLLEVQPYRLAYWRVSGEEINYRRFFDVNDLVGLRQEFPDVFASTHQLLRKMIAEKQVDGVRIDHVDGLYNPLQYLIRLQMLSVAAETCGADPCETVAENGIEISVQDALANTEYSRETAPFYCLVEKILEHGEHLPSEWPVHGTSGYEFMNLLNGIFIEPTNVRRFTQIYERFTGLTTPIRDLIYASKKLTMHVAMSSEVYVLSHLLARLSATDRYARDFTAKSLRDAVRETIACFPVYRTYIDERGQYTPRDREYVETAIRRAKRLNPSMSTAVFDYLRSVLLLAPKRFARDEAAAQEDYRQKLHVALKFQQLTGPVMAKGLEDTVCYVYNRFVSINEVGGSPEVFGISLDEFHAGNRLRAGMWPHSMLASSTHDTKRSEDVRARLNVLSENPSGWSARVLRWRRLNRTQKVELADGRIVPDYNEEYLLYQTIIGSCPINLSEDRQGYITRIQQYMNKAVHEAKVNLSWVSDDPEYVQALEKFIAAILSPDERGESAFVSDLLAFLPEIAYHGAINSISQTLLKLTAPGVPDTYQGTELLDLSLVDPDNRRPVNYEVRRRVLERLHGTALDTEFRRDLLNDLQYGPGKMFVLERVLQVRERSAKLFKSGDYVPLAGHGDRGHHVISFVREYNGNRIIVAAPRFTYSLMRGKLNPPTDDVWGNTNLVLPPDFASITWENVLTGERHVADDRQQLLVRDLFLTFPFALLRHA